MLFIGIPTLGRPVTLGWAFAFKALGVPMNVNSQFGIIHGKPVADARNELCQLAIDAGAKWIMFIGDDTVPPPHTLRQFLMRMGNDPTLGVVGGVYCSRVDPSAPMVFKGNGSGPYWDWKFGEYFECTGLGMDCTMIRLEALQSLPYPWFKTVDTDSFLEGKNAAESWTEDLYFLTRLHEAGQWKIMCDASVIADHVDAQTGRVYKIPVGTLPYRQLACVNGDKKAIDLGCGPIYKEIPGHMVVRVDADERHNPDYRLDVRQLPFADTEFDYVYSSHVLEHIPRRDMHATIREWVRILKYSGKIEIIVPDVAWAARRLLEKPASMEDKDTLNVLYGGQTSFGDFHNNGFNEWRLGKEFENAGIIIHSLTSDGYNLRLIGERHGP